MTDDRNCYEHIINIIDEYDRAIEVKSESDLHRATELMLLHKGRRFPMALMSNSDKLIGAMHKVMCLFKEHRPDEMLVCTTLQLYHALAKVSCRMKRALVHELAMCFEHGAWTDSIARLVCETMWVCVEDEHCANTVLSMYIWTVCRWRDLTRRALDVVCRCVEYHTSDPEKTSARWVHALTTIVPNLDLDAPQGQWDVHVQRMVYRNFARVCDSRCWVRPCFDRMRKHRRALDICIDERIQIMMSYANFVIDYKSSLGEQYAREDIERNIEEFLTDPAVSRIEVLSSCTQLMQRFHGLCKSENIVRAILGTCVETQFDQPSALAKITALLTLNHATTQTMFSVAPLVSRDDVRALAHFAFTLEMPQFDLMHTIVSLLDKLLAMDASCLPCLPTLPTNYNIARWVFKDTHVSQMNTQ